MAADYSYFIEISALCPRCGRRIKASGSDPWHMAFCRGGCGWYGIVEHCIPITQEPRP